MELQLEFQHISDLQNVDSNELLKKLSSFSDKKKENSWISSIIIFFVSVFAIFIFAWVSGRNAKKIAELKHEKNKKEVEKDNLDIVMHRELNEERILDLAIKIDNNKTELKNINKKIQSAAKAHQENLKNINSITGWKDI